MVDYQIDNMCLRCQSNMKRNNQMEDDWCKCHYFDNDEAGYNGCWDRQTMGKELVEKTLMIGYLEFIQAFSLTNFIYLFVHIVVSGTSRSETHPCSLWMLTHSAKLSLHLSNSAFHEKLSQTFLNNPYRIRWWIERIFAFDYFHNRLRANCHDCRSSNYVADWVD